MRFKAKPYKLGNSWVITLPADFIQNEYIDPNRKYWFVRGEEVLKSHSEDQKPVNAAGKNLEESKKDSAQESVNTEQQN